jgi:hypothetical protein
MPLKALPRQEPAMVSTAWSNSAQLRWRIGGAQDFSRPVTVAVMDMDMVTVMVMVMVRLWTIPPGVSSLEQSQDAPGRAHLRGPY